MLRKEHDWFVETINNPGFTNTDFKTLGITADNTSIADFDVYKNNEYIRELFKTEEGNVDELKLEKAYTQALSTFNLLALDTYQDDVNKTYVASRNNIFVSPEQRMPEGTELQIGFTKNPMEDVKGVYKLGFTEEGPLTIEEIAQTLKVFDPDTGKWSDSPNDSFFSNFFNTLVLAQWDYNADINGNPTDDESKIVYEKGEYKYNEEGKPYYEYLNGRSTAGKTILHKSDILTDDKSALNAIDFFDSDSKEKSTWGVLMKNLVSIAPMLIPHTFVPYVASVYIGTGIALNFGKLAATAGKVLGGSNIDILNNTDGFIDSLSLSQHKSDAKNQWSLANLIDLSGMVFKQLAEQRWLFKYGPALMQGKIWDDAAQQAYKLGKIDELTKLRDAKLLKLEKEGSLDYFKFFQESAAAIPGKALAMLDAKNKYYQKLGEELSRIYMTGLVVSDSYNEAKRQNLSDLEASAYTLGYALAEYGILKTDIGKWVMPELKLSAYKNRKIINAAKANLEKTSGEVIKRSEQAIAGKIAQQESKFMSALHKGIQKFKLDERLGVNLGKFAVANALSEGVEETSEELLADVSKQLFNWSAILRGDESRLDAWENMFDRYSMSLVGGIMGGGLFSITPDLKKAYKAVDSITTRSQAIAEIATMSRNGELEPFLKQLNKTTVASKNLSMRLASDTEGSVYAQAKGYEDSQDYAVKRALVQLVKLIDDIITKNNLKISDDSLLDASIMSDVRYSRLLNSTQASRYIDEFEKLTGDLVRLEGELQGLLNPGNQTLENQLADNKDSNKPSKEAEEKKEKEIASKIQAKEEEIKQAKEELIKYTNGEKAPDFILDSIFEMEQTLSGPFIVGTLSTFAKAHTGRELSTLNDKEIEEVKSAFVQYKKGKLADNVKIARQMFDSVLDTLSPHLTPEYLESLQMLDDKFVLDLESVALSLGEELVEVNGLQQVQPITNLEKLGNLLSNSIKALSHIIATYTELGESTSNSEELNKLYALFSEVLPKEYAELQQKEKDKLLEIAVKELQVKDNPNDLLAQQEYGKLNKELLDIQNEMSEKKVESAKAYEEYEAGVQMLLPLKLGLVVLKLLGKVISPMTKKLLQKMAIELADSVPGVLSLINALSVSPAQELVKSFSLVLGKDINIPLLIDLLQNKLVSSYQKIDDFGMDDLQEQALAEAINMLNLLKSALHGFRVDAGLTNIFGYSITKNELLGTALAEIDSKQIDPIISELSKILDQLEYLLRIYELNSGQRLKVQERTSVNLTTILYKRILRLSLYIPEDKWEGVQEFKESLEKAQAILDIIRQKRTELSDSELLALEANKKEMEMAVHKLFRANMDKFDDLQDIFSLANCPGILQENEITITDKSEDIDDTSFYWYIASLTAINPNDFYFKYKDLIKGSKVAPILILEILSFMGYASLVAPNIFNTFALLLQTIILTQSTDNYGIGYSKEYPEGSAYYPRFGDVYLIEGVPGGGKSTVIMNNIIKLLGEDHPLLKKVFNVHSSIGNAKKSSELWNLKNVTNFDRDEILRRVSHDHLGKFEHKRGQQIVKDIKNVSLSEKGLETINSLINKESDPPTLMIIDEVSLFSSFDIEVITKWCKQHGTKLILMGDMLQTTLGGTQKFSNLVTLKVANSRGYYAHGPKVGVSMRGNNTQQSLNEVLLRDAVDKGNYPTEPLHWKKVDKELFGFQVLSSIAYDSFTENKNIIDDLKNRIKDMIATLKPDKDGNPLKIGYIYDSGKLDNLLLYCLEKLTGDPEWVEIAKHIEKIDGVTFSGIEGQYFIVELPNYMDDLAHLKEIYTAITRAQSGGILINGDLEFFISNTGSEDSYTKYEGYSEASVEAYANKRSRILNEVYTEGKDIPYTTEVKKKSEKPEEKSKELTEDNDLATVEKIVKGNIEPHKQKVKAAIQRKIEEEQNILEDNEKSDDKVHQGFTLLFWSFNTNVLTSALSLRKKASADYVQACENFRIDGLFGLSRALTGRTEELLINNYYALKSAFIQSKSEEELLSKINEFLQINGEVSIELAFKSSYITDSVSKGFERFLVHPSEITSELYNPDGDKRTCIKRLVGIININGKPSIEIPLLTLNNWETVITSPLFSDIKTEFDIWINIGKNKELKGGVKSYAFGEYLESKYSNDLRIMYFAQLCKMYKYTSNGIFYLDENINGESALNYFLKTKEITGPMIRNTDISNNNKYSSFKPLWTSIDAYLGTLLFVISKPLAVTTEVTYNDFTINPGIPFVFISDDPMIDRDSLHEEFKKGNPNVSLIYLSNPLVTVDEYFTYLGGTMTKNPETNKRNRDAFDKHMGNLLTDFYIAHKLVNTLTDDLLDLISGHGSGKARQIREAFNKAFAEMESMNTSDKLKKVYEEIRVGSLNNVVIKYLSSEIIWNAYKSNTEGVINLRNEVVNAAKTLYPQGIFYNVSLNPKSQGVFVEFITADNNEYAVSINGKFRYFQLIGKIDPSMVIADASLILNSFMANRTSSDGTVGSSQHNDRYLEKKSKEEKYDPTVFINNEILHEDVREELLKHVELLDSERAITDKIIKLGYIIIPVERGKKWISNIKLPNGQTLEEIIYADLENPRPSKLLLTTNTGNTYNLTKINDVWELTATALELKSDTTNTQGPSTDAVQDLPDLLKLAIDAIKRDKSLMDVLRREEDTIIEDFVKVLDEELSIEDININADDFVGTIKELRDFIERDYTNQAGLLNDLIKSLPNANNTTSADETCSTTIKF